MALAKGSTVWIHWTSRIKHVREYVTRHTGNFHRLTLPKRDMSDTLINKGAPEVGVVVPVDELTTFMVRCLTAVGAPGPHAKVLSDNLVSADHRGHKSHGLARLGMYIRDVRNGFVAVNSEPEVLQETVSTALVEGHNLLGPVVGTFCMDLAIRKARDTGIGLVTAKGSNHFGIAASYGIQAMNQGFIGLAMTNTTPRLVPTRAKKMALGTNPICLAAPAEDGDSFIADMATSAVAYGKVQVANKAGTPIPEGWAIDSAGKMTTDAAEGCVGGLFPLGGQEITSGYKGYGLAMMVEIFCGILSGAAYGPNVRNWQLGDGTVANLGQCFIAINPECFADGFSARLSDLISSCRNLEPAEEDKPVLVPGDPERQHVEKCDKLGGIPYTQAQFETVGRIAEDLGVVLPLTVRECH